MTAATLPARAVRERVERVPGWLKTGVGVLALALLLWLVYGEGPIGYDTSYALLWGDQLAHAHLPDYVALHAPTPHPLANLVFALSYALALWHFFKAVMSDPGFVARPQSRSDRRQVGQEDG